MLHLRGYNQREFARSIGITESALSAILKGKSQTIRSDNLTAMAQVLQVSADVLLGLAPIPVEGNPKGAAIVEVISAGETLGWEEVARRIKAATSDDVESRPKPIVIPLPDKPLPVPEELKPRKLMPGEKVVKKPKGEDH